MPAPLATLPRGDGGCRPVEQPPSSAQLRAQRRNFHKTFSGEKPAAISAFSRDASASASRVRGNPAPIKIAVSILDDLSQNHRDPGWWR
jgi:hypothetical protein